MTAFLLVIGPLVLVPAMWLAVVALIAWAGGWRSLADRYPASEEPAGHAFMWGNSVGLTLLGGYNNCVHIAANERGLDLRTIVFFRFSHPPIFIPWSAVARCETGRFFFRRSAILVLRDSDSKVRITGSASSTVMEMYAFASRR